jgi:hypothetical protein
MALAGDFKTLILLFEQDYTDERINRIKKTTVSFWYCPTQQNLAIFKSGLE